LEKDICRYLAGGIPALTSSAANPKIIAYGFNLYSHTSKLHKLSL
jgi:hypothetical protein